MDAQQRLRLHASSVGQAREMVRQELVHAGRGDLVETAVLLVSELVTNALLHAGTQVEVSLSASEAGALVLVGDGSPQQPRVAGPQAEAIDTGRGLVLVEQLSTAWGAMATPRGKVVWFQLDTPPTTRVSRPPRPTVAAATVRVELYDLPVKLYQAWQQHAAQRLREQLLAQLEAVPDNDAEVLRRHAHASNALTILTRYLRRSDGTPIDETGHRGAPGNALVVQVPRACVGDFTVLANTLVAGAPDDADATARYGYRSEELAALTRWLCGQVEGQARGVPPAAWQAEQT